MTRPARTASFYQRSNNLAERGLSFRLFRFLRSRVRAACHSWAQLADEPRMLSAWRKGWDREHYLRLLRWRDRGFAPRCIYDIGAHRGGWSEMCEELFAPETIFLFEPQTDLMAGADYARRRPHWKIVPVALGAQPETRTFYVTQNVSASSCLRPEAALRALPEVAGATREQTLTVVPLDTWASANHAPMPDLVKIDVQGFEGEVLAGGRATIAQARHVVIEVSLRRLYESQGRFTATLTTLEAMGFELEEISDAHRDWPSGVLWQVDLWLQKKRA